MALPNFIKATQAQILSGTIKEGTVIFTSDSHNLYWDADATTRVKVTDIIELASESDRIALASPSDKFYYVFSTGVFWRHHNGAWSMIGGVSGESSILSPTQPSGQKESDSWLEIII